MTARRTVSGSDGSATAASRDGLTPVDLDVKTYKGAIFEALTAKISELELRPGERLVEADLARLFRVSKTPVREAFLLLEADGLVELSPYVGARVSWMSIDAYEEQQFIFDALEQPALPRVAERLSDASIERAKRYVEELRGQREAGASLEYSRTLWKLHSEMFSAAGFPKLVKMILHEGRNGRRYQRVFIHQFDDTWDIELELVVNRFEGIARREPQAAALAVAEGHRRIIELTRARADDPRISSFLGGGAAT